MKKMYCEWHVAAQFNVWFSQALHVYLVYLYFFINRTYVYLKSFYSVLTSVICYISFNRKASKIINRSVNGETQSNPHFLICTYMYDWTVHMKSVRFAVWRTTRLERPDSGRSLPPPPASRVDTRALSVLIT